MKCRHELDATEEYRRHPTEPRSALWRRVCWHCGEWLSLGPANDDDERVAIEIRAAELAMLPRGAFTTHEANQGYHAYHRGWPVDPPRDSQAGYLAACIAAHEED